MARMCLASADHNGSNDSHASSVSSNTLSSELPATSPTADNINLLDGILNEQDKQDTADQQISQPSQSSVSLISEIIKLRNWHIN